MRQTLKETLSLIHADMSARCIYENKTLNWLRRVRFVFFPATASVMLYRWQIFFYQHHLQFIASILKVLNGVLFTVDIDSRTEIGPGFLLLHSSFICIGPQVKIGKNCLMAHQNSVAPSPFYNADHTHLAVSPTLGDNVMLGGGATVIGGVVIGNHVQISMNSAVDASFPDNAVLFGVPAKNIAQPKSAEAST